MTGYGGALFGHTSVVVSIHRAERLLWILELVGRHLVQVLMSGKEAGMTNATMNEGFDKKTKMNKNLVLFRISSFKSPCFSITQLDNSSTSTGHKRVLYSMPCMYPQLIVCPYWFLLRISSR